MMLSGDDIKDFREIYRHEFKEEVAEGDARVMANNLIELYRVLAQPLPSEMRKDPREDANVPHKNL